MKEKSSSKQEQLFVTRLLTFALTGCGAGSSGPIDPEGQISVSATQTSIDGGGAALNSSEIDACSLVTQADAEAALGKSTEAGVRSDISPIFSCSYQTAEFDSVSVTAVIYESSVQAQAAYDLTIEINGYPEITGLGYLAYNAQPIFDVTVISGNYEVSIDIADSSDQAVQLRESIELAALAISRLP